MSVRPRAVPERIEFYFSYRSPYAWFASRRLAGILGGLPISVEYCPVWEPEPELEAHLERAGLRWGFAQPSREKRRYIFQDVRRHVREYGLRFTWPIDREACWSLPHLGFLHARAAGRGLAYHDRIFSLRFEEGRDITQPESVVEVLRSLDLDAERFLHLVQVAAFDEEVVECFRRAERAGVVGWPFFTFGRERFWGNDRLDWLAAAVRETQKTVDVNPAAGAEAARGLA